MSVSFSSFFFSPSLPHRLCSLDVLLNECVQLEEKCSSLAGLWMTSTCTCEMATSWSRWQSVREQKSKQQVEGGVGEQSGAHCSSLLLSDIPSYVKRAIVMPNLVPPVVDTEMVRQVRGGVRERERGEAGTEE